MASTSYQEYEHPPGFFQESSSKAFGRVLRDRFQQGATPLCFSTLNSTYVLPKNQGVVRHVVRSHQHLLAHAALKFQFMAEHHQEYPVTTMWHVLEVSVSGYYARHTREPSRHSREDAELANKIKGAFQSNRCVYGSSRLHAELHA